MKIDAHQHFWIYDDVEFAWLTDDMAALRRDFLPCDIPLECDADGIIAVQARQSLDENQFLLGLAARYEQIVGVVGWVDLLSSEVEVQLALYPGLCGVRHILQAEPDDRFMLRDDFQSGLSCVTDAGLTYDLLIYPRHLPYATELVDQHPDQRFVLDHLSKPTISAQLIEPWRTELSALAERPNVWCKVSGLVTEAHWQSWKHKDIEPFLNTALESFGPERLIFGSDWPVCLVAGSYEQVQEVVMTWSQKLSQSERDMIFGGAAQAAYILTT